MKKRMMAMFMAILTVLALGLSVYADAPTNRKITAEQQALYQAYQTILDELNAQYGRNVRLLPIEEVTNFCSLEEFRQKNEDFCRFLQAEMTFSANKTVQTRAMQTASCTRSLSYPNVGTVYVTISGQFEVRLNLDGNYYILSSNYPMPEVVTTNSLLDVCPIGSVQVTMIDHARTRYVTQSYKISCDGTSSEEVTFGCYFYFNKTTGVVTANQS